mmetsp:Transcript_13012/g.28502  ORF Transcript_13012/g.28502 Transcript_13012/m.28502 type:complete len:141 (+) Transcript_13012:2-424(+)
MTGKGSDGMSGMMGNIFIGGMGGSGKKNGYDAAAPSIATPFSPSYPFFGGSKGRPGDAYVGKKGGDNAPGGKKSDGYDSSGVYAPTSPYYASVPAPRMRWMMRDYTNIYNGDGMRRVYSMGRGLAVAPKEGLLSTTVDAQ